MAITVNGNKAINLRGATIATVQKVGATNDVTLTFNDGTTLAFPNVWTSYAQDAANVYASSDGTYNLQNTAVTGLTAGHTAIAVLKANVQSFGYDSGTKTATYTLPQAGAVASISTVGYSYNVFPQ